MGDGGDTPRWVLVVPGAVRRPPPASPTRQPGRGSWRRGDGGDTRDPVSLRGCGSARYQTPALQEASGRCRAASGGKLRHTCPPERVGGLMWGGGYTLACPTQGSPRVSCPLWRLQVLPVGRATLRLPHGTAQPHGAWLCPIAQFSGRAGKPRGEPHGSAGCASCPTAHHPTGCHPDTQYLTLSRPIAQRPAGRHPA